MKGIVLCCVLYVIVTLEHPGCSCLDYVSPATKRPSGIRYAGIQVHVASNLARHVRRSGDEKALAFADMRPTSLGRSRRPATEGLNGDHMVDSRSTNIPTKYTFGENLHPTTPSLAVTLLHRTAMTEVAGGNSPDWRNTSLGAEEEDDGGCGVRGTGNASVVEAARDLSLYKIGRQIHLYWMPVIVPVGIMGNLLAFVVLMQPASRRVSCCLYMAALAVSDTILLLDGTYYYIATILLPNHYTMSDEDCQAMAYILQVAFSMGATLLIAMTVDRYLAVRSPLKAKMTCTPRRAILIICALIPFCFIYNLPHLYMSGMVDNTTCAAFQTDDISAQFFSWMNFATNCVLPFIVILTLNTGIILTLRSRSRRFQHKASTSTVSSSCSGNSSWSSTARPAYRSLDSARDTQLAAMLLLVSFVFLLLTLPQYSRYAVYTFVDFCTSAESYATFIFVYHLSNKCYYTNSAINFLLYCIAGSRFRSDLKTMCRNRTLHLKTPSALRARSTSADSTLSEISMT